MRHLAWIAALTVVALAAWWFLAGAPRRGGDGVSRAAAVGPTARETVREGPRDLTVDAPGAAEPQAAERPQDARAPAPQDKPERLAAPLGEREGFEDRPLGGVAGLLRSESGGWPDLDGLLQGGVVVELHDPADPRSTRRARLEPVAEPDGSTAIAFRFEGVRPGLWTLAVSSLAAEVWEPATQTVTAPVGDLVAWCRDRIERVRLVFDVRDAQSGAPIETWEANALRQTVTQAEGVLLHAGPLQREAFPVDGRLDWSVAAADHAPAFGDERSFVPDGAGAWIARVDLHRGWAARVVVLARDPGMRPIEDAEVEAGGVVVGVTGARGWLDVARPAAPGELVVRWGGLERRVAPVREATSDEARRRGQMLVVVLE